ncbi:MAG TPA: phenylalanine--tRNA ligase subunit alpha [Spirochaetota bacterium]|jgi:phenylalanyl-tRNA synthetase alpha chain|nr:phenylalanine--tRNA ligase subunit alpha [Spirochaetota bacterium]OPZ35955.1 MAG: Phenylalanine--tRNA ligase alpha subunit [Spirochaetes bacterium ADurb.BinA120]HNU91793.1 phenylalanine--tRNA ligase subunit alpha [Spirochaetota bacterium]HPI14036.1 phenylalanine--tRNA ligase subunit alpha [Spirochaetota bacterium]HPV98807.1 phenylalanine--tRNA ligase subunit alpha [Spirochaetota bacterium]
MEQKLEAIRASATERISAVQSIDELEAIRVKVLGRKGELTAILRTLGELSPEERSQVGQKSNQVKAALEALLENRKAELLDSRINAVLQKEWLDVTLSSAGSSRPFEPGHLHPLSQIQYEIEDIFTSMGFTVLDGPEVETDYYNFEALNIPAHHPARDMQDTFWTEDGNLLRTHTSAIQVRGMEKLKPPFRVIGPGRVFRYEATDASHENTFYQVEGMMVDRDISVADLIYFMKVLLKEIFGREVTIRLRPGYFPFVEPGFELDIQCLICEGKGCGVCKRTGWVELLPCGLVQPNVLRYGKIDPDEWSGFAFGLGMNRLVMMRYGINDIRHFLSGDIRFLRQF